ncbi:MAG TPA: hypothetical protein VGN41_24595 [Streptosporangiaceae bacterium]|jgi:hypothetical protein
MTDTTTAVRDLQGEILRTVNQSQEAALDAIRDWTETVHSLTPKLPMVNMPFGGQLPKPEEFVASMFDFAEQLLASQRKFAVDLVRATTPLLPGWDEVPAAKPAGGPKNGAAAK